MVFNADLVSRSPLTGSGYSDKPSSLQNRKPDTGAVNIVTRILHLLVGGAVVAALVQYTSGEVLVVELFAWGGISAGALKAASSVLLFLDGPMNVIKNVEKAENELEVGLRRLSSWGILVAGAVLYGLTVDSDVHEFLGIGLATWVLVLGVAARVSDYTIDVSLQHTGNNFKDVTIGDDNP